MCDVDVDWFMSCLLVLSKQSGAMQKLNQQKRHGFMLIKLNRGKVVDYSGISQIVQSYSKNIHQISNHF